LSMMLECAAGLEPPVTRSFSRVWRQIAINFFDKQDLYSFLKYKIFMYSLKKIKARRKNRMLINEGLLMLMQEVKQKKDEEKT
jgi:hypothetical protein